MNKSPNGLCHGMKLGTPAPINYGFFEGLAAFYCIQCEKARLLRFYLMDRIGIHVTQDLDKVKDFQHLAMGKSVTS